MLMLKDSFLLTRRGVPESDRAIASARDHLLVIKREQRLYSRIEIADPLVADSLS